MTENEQVQEMAKIAAKSDDTCRAATIAKGIYNSGYRKAKRGEWVKSQIPGEKYNCSVCGGAAWYYDAFGDICKSNFCPNCGADMRGGENERI